MTVWAKIFFGLYLICRRSKIRDETAAASLFALFMTLDIVVLVKALEAIVTYVLDEPITTPREVLWPLILFSAIFFSFFADGQIRRLSIREERYSQLELRKMELHAVAFVTASTIATVTARYWVQASWQIADSRPHAGHPFRAMPV